MGWGIKLTDEQWNELGRLRFSAKSAISANPCDRASSAVFFAAATARSIKPAT